MNNNSTVSVFMMAYNHEKYVAQALDSLLVQETTKQFVNYDTFLDLQIDMLNSIWNTIEFDDKHLERLNKTK